MSTKITTEGDVIRAGDGNATDSEMHRQAEAEREASNESYRQLAEALPDIVFSALPNGAPDFLNSQWYAYTGATREEDTYATWHATLHPDDRECATDAWRHSLETGASFEIEYRLRGVDGQYRWFLARGIPQRDAEERIIRWFGTATNIDRQKREEEKQRFLARLSEETRPLAAPEEVMTTAMRLLGDHLQAARTAYNTVDEASDQITAQRDYCTEGESLLGAFTPSAFGAAWLADLRAGRTVIVADTAADSRTAPAFETAYQRLGIRSFIAAPLLKEGKLVTILSVNMRAPRAWAEEEAALVEAVAERTWLAVQSAREAQQRRRAEEALRETGKRIRFIADNAPAFISNIDTEYRYVFANRASAERFGLTPEEIVGKSVAEVMGREAFATIRPYMERAFRGETFSYEMAVPYARLGTRYMQVFFAPDMAEDGSVRGLVAVVHDMSERKEADSARAALAAIVQSSEDAIVSKDLNGIVTSWNPAAERIYGYPAQEIIGQSKALVMPPELPEELPTILRKIRAGERIEHYDTVRLRKDGKRINLSITVSPIRDSTGQIIGASTIARDITERKQLEARLRDETRTLETIHAIGLRLSAELDLETMVQAATDAATSLTGAQFGAFFYNVVNTAGESYTLYTISGVPREMFSRFPMPRNTAVFAPTFAGKGTVRLDDVTQDPRYGGNAPYQGQPPGHLPVVSYLAVPVVSRSGEVLGGLFFGHEQPAMFTERHARIVEGVAAQAAIAIDNARLFQAERERSEQLAMAVREVHHRVKNSLQGVSALLEMQIIPGEDTVPVEVIRDSLGQIKTIALVHDLLAHDKPMGSVDVAQVLAKLVAMLEVTLGTSETPRPIRLEAASLSIPTRPAISLALVANELITNAAKHSVTKTSEDPTGQEATLYVRLQVQREEAHLSVQDNGPGFPPNFDPIRDAHIGLELVQTLVANDLKGSISFRNRAGSSDPAGGLEARGASVEITFSPDRLTD